MSVRETSLEAYRALEGAGSLQEQEKKLMRLVHRHFPLPARFTRKELAAVTGWGINVITGRTHGLVRKGFLTDYEETRDGSHLLSISESKTAAPATVTRDTDESVRSAAHAASGRPASPDATATTPPVAAAPRTATPQPSARHEPAKRSGQAAVADREVKGLLDELKPGDLVWSFGELCEVVVAPGIVTAHYLRNEKPAQHDYQAMTVRPLKVRRAA